MRPKPYLFIAVFLFVSLNIFAQRKNYAGILFGAEKASTGETRAIVGLSFERKINKHHFVGTGLHYRSTISDQLIVYIPAGGNSSITEQYFVLEEYLSVPILYTY